MSAVDEGIGFERYAEVSAYLRRFPSDKKEEVIARLGLRRRAWEAAAAKWSAAKNEELATGKTDLSTRFAALFSRTKERLAREHVSLEAVGPLPGPEELEPEPAVAAPPPEPVVDVPPPVIQRISAQLAPAVMPPAPTFLVGRSAPAAAPIAAAPIAAAPIAAAPITAAFSLEPPAPADGTALFDRPLAPRAALPFPQASVGPEEALASAIAHTEVVQGRHPRPPAALTGTSEGIMFLPKTPVLPFQGPAASGSLDEAGSLTLIQYASLRVELDVYPADAAATLARYGVRDRAPVDAVWRTRFEHDPMARMEFVRAYAQYSAWLKSNVRR